MHFVRDMFLRNVNVSPMLFNRGQPLRLPDGRHLPLHRGGKGAVVGYGIYDVPIEKVISKR